MQDLSVCVCVCVCIVTHYLCVCVCVCIVTHYLCVCVLSLTTYLSVCVCIVTHTIYVSVYQLSHCLRISKIFQKVEAGPPDKKGGNKDGWEQMFCRLISVGGERIN